jgi:hypothetical protein
MVERTAKKEDANGLLTRVNRTQVKLFGLDFVLRRGKPASSRVPPEYEFHDELRLFFRYGYWNDAMRGSTPRFPGGDVEVNIVFSARNSVSLYYDVSMMPYDVAVGITEAAHEVELGSTPQELVDRMPGYLKEYVADKLLREVQMKFMRLDMGGQVVAGLESTPDGRIVLQGDAGVDLDAPEIWLSSLFETVTLFDNKTHQIAYYSRLDLARQLLEARAKRKEDNEDG